VLKRFRPESRRKNTYESGGGSAVGIEGHIKVKLKPQPHCGDYRRDSASDGMWAIARSNEGCYCEGGRKNGAKSLWFFFKRGF